MRSLLLAIGVISALGALAAGCADGSNPPPRRDGGPVDDGAVDGGGFDGGPPIDTGMSMMDDAGDTDAGRGMGMTCQACTEDRDCEDGYCAPLTGGGMACLPRCNIDIPDCPPRFECVTNFSSSIPEPICAPVGERCCVDPDGDLHGAGVGCLAADCDETNPDVNASGTETCDGTDEDCDGNVDEGEPGVLCPVPAHVAATACVSGVCQIAMCEPTFADCNMASTDGCEVNTDTTSDCGGCGMACALPHVVSHVCDAGACTVGECAPGYGDCNGDDADGCEQPLDTTNHCGGCGITCGLANAASMCAGGVCGIATCDRNWGDCDGRAANGCEAPLVTNTDCGTCGTICSPAGGAGDCSTGTCRVTTCGAGLADCNMDTADGCETSTRTLTDCGVCGLTCSFPNATASCAAGACSLVDCVSGFGNCDGVTTNGCETVVNTVLNCGACGRACAPAHATGMCAAGMCGIASCDAGWADCDGNVANGCETSLRTTTDCGACGASCTRPGAVAECSTGVCRTASCITGYAECDGMDVNGCETPIRTLTDCGGCGVVCSRLNASASCATGTCGITSCNSGYANCDGIDANGCETSLSTTSSCGTCGAACTRANATATCGTGTCQIDTCNAGYANCDGVDANGCETPLNTLTNCGACGDACNLANAGESCASGTCQITMCVAAYGDCDLADANGCETSLRTTTDCGGCAVVCARSNASATCATGSCAISGCNAGFGNCDGSDMNGCEAPLTSLTNCGACGTACDLPNAGESCSTGTCTLGACTSGFGNCDGTTSNGCETALTSLSNCGACGTVCALTNATETCSTGACRIMACSAGFENCDSNQANGCETSTRTLTNCGGCGVTCSRTNAAATCGTGTCGIASCNAGFGNCDAVDANGCEVSLTTLTSCGGCGVVCDLPHATESCSTGTCGLVACDAGWGNCDGAASNGCETPLTTLTNCGACGTLCDLPGAGESCATGTCQLSGCTTGFGDCNMMSGDGCETALTTLTNCGGCGTVCNLANATETCTTGTCAIGVCSSGFGNCDSLPANGCEAPLNTLSNCGGCGVACNLANGGESCATGSCEVTTCNAGYGNCDGIASNGCETNTQTTLTSCGSCGNVCSLPNATPTCTAGACGIASCLPGFADCDGIASNGCETPLNTLSNCGGCGMVCNLANGSESCATGTCSLTSCDAGFSNCDGNPANGCERSITSLTDCGGCGVTCNLANGAESCASGVCTLTSCDAGFGNCDMASANGCEQPLNTVSNCGTCGTACGRANAAATCATGSCAIGSCNAGFGNCDAIDANGCETNTQTNVSNCGTCGTNCTSAPHPNATGQTCSAGMCSVTTCAASYFDTNGIFSDGCECQADAWGDSCSLASNIGTVAVGASVTRSGNLVGTTDTDWFQVTFDATATCSRRPRITVATTPSSLPVAFRVFTSCTAGAAGGGFACTEGGTSASGLRTSWDVNLRAGEMCGPQQQVDPAPATGTFIADPTTVWIQVDRTGSSTTCLPYTITISN